MCTKREIFTFYIIRTACTDFVNLLIYVAAQNITSAVAMVTGAGNVASLPHSVTLTAKLHNGIGNA